MVEHDEYFSYLLTRSRLGDLYRTHVLYPRLAKRLTGKALDVGCGIGDMLRFRPGTTGVDINPHTVAYCTARGLSAFVMQPDHLPFKASEFDSALLDNVLEHIAEPDPLLQEIYRVVRSGGRLLVGVPGARGFLSDPDHKVRYDEGSLRVRLERAGFRTVETFHAPLVRSGFLDRNMRQYCIYSLTEKA